MARVSQSRRASAPVSLPHSSDSRTTRNYGMAAPMPRGFCMDAWSSIVMVVNILLLIAGWLLFQQAKSDLTARAAEVPVLSEIKALQKSIAALLEQLKLESAQSSAHLEARCLEARDLLTTLDRRLEEARESKPAARPSRRRESAASDRTERTERPDATAVSSEPGEARPDTTTRYEAIYSLADEGLAHADIAQRTGHTAGEVELILGLRNSVRS
jgi:hypothetical protein